jgi:hypothetical protein
MREFTQRKRCTREDFGMQIEYYDEENKPKKIWLEPDQADDFIDDLESGCLIGAWECPYREFPLR